MKASVAMLSWACVSRGLRGSILTNYKVRNPNYFSLAFHAFVADCLAHLDLSLRKFIGIKTFVGMKTLVGIGKMFDISEGRNQPAGREKALLF